MPKLDKLALKGLANLLVELDIDRGVIAVSLEDAMPQVQRDANDAATQKLQQASILALQGAGEIRVKSTPTSKEIEESTLAAVNAMKNLLEAAGKTSVPTRVDDANRLMQEIQQILPKIEI